MIHGLVFKMAAFFTSKMKWGRQLVGEIYFEEDNLDFHIFYANQRPHTYLF